MHSGAPEIIWAGRTAYVKFVDKRNKAFYIPSGFAAEDEVHCWKLKVDAATNRTFFVNVGGRGKRWTLPDISEDQPHHSIGERVPPRKYEKVALQTDCKDKHLNEGCDGAYQTGENCEDLYSQPADVEAVNTNIKLSERQRSPRKEVHHKPVDVTSLELANEKIRPRHGVESEAFVGQAPLLGVANLTKVVETLQRLLDEERQHSVQLRNQLEEADRLNMEREQRQTERERKDISVRLRMLEALALFRSLERKLDENESVNCRGTAGPFAQF